MSNALDRYTRASEGFETRLRGVGPDQWTASTPCEDWNVSALVTHLIGSHHLMLSTLDQAHDTPGEGDDLLPVWSATRTAVLDALGDETTASKIVASPFGEMPFSGLVGGLLCGDTLFHTWDLARATGQDETLDGGLCATQLEMMLPLDELIRTPGFFGPKLDASDDATSQSKLLLFGGRRP
ncbi:MAG TPA: TIGR03086 family metal-binding protein [Acidimicrobiales bacterium]|nr:TIGR03086 family metal-binding protein [Acidimicrobiales bacterium]